MITKRDHSSNQVVEAGQNGLQQQLIDMGTPILRRQTIEQFQYILHTRQYDGWHGADGCLLL
jgi:hypothetical protein